MAIITLATIDIREALCNAVRDYGARGVIPRDHLIELVYSADVVDEYMHPQADGDFWIGEAIARADDYAVLAAWGAAHVPDDPLT